MLLAYLTVYQICHLSHISIGGGQVVHTATEDVWRKTPPSGFAFRVGAAVRNSQRLLLTLVVQHCHWSVSGLESTVSCGDIIKPYPIPNPPSSTGRNGLLFVSMPISRLSVDQTEIRSWSQPSCKRKDEFSGNLPRSRQGYLAPPRTRCSDLPTWRSHFQPQHPIGTKMPDC